MDLFGFEVEVWFLVGEEVIAYAWHYNAEKARRQLERIMEYHSLDGKIERSPRLEKWLSKELHKVVVRGEPFELPNLDYTNRKVYLELLKVSRGETITYSDLARRAGVRYQTMLKALMRNPFQILIPCHRLITKKGTLMGFYPLGKEVKKRLLELEGYSEGSKGKIDLE